jgi:xanthine dehydrogenase accessory factor
VIEGPHVGAVLVITSEGNIAGSLGDDNLDRVVGRDAMGELEAGRTIVRHYGPKANPLLKI